MPLIIKTLIKESSTQGFGLFTDENLDEGQKIYFDDPNFEKIIFHDEKLKMPPETQLFIETFAPFNKDGKFYYLNTDNSRFWNHSENPNTVFVRENGTHLGSVFTLRAIAKGEELTADYREFCDNCKDGNFGFKLK